MRWTAVQMEVRVKGNGRGGVCVCVCVHLCLSMCTSVSVCTCWIEDSRVPHGIAFYFHTLGVFHWGRTFASPTHTHTHYHTKTHTPITRHLPQPCFPTSICPNNRQKKWVQILSPKNTLENMQGNMSCSLSVCLWFVCFFPPLLSPAPWVFGSVT